MVEVWPIIAVTRTIPYTTFTYWVLGVEIIAVKRVSSPFRSRRSLPLVLRKLNISLAFFRYVYGDILLIAVSIIPIGSGRVSP